MGSYKLQTEKKTCLFYLITQMITFTALLFKPPSTCLVNYNPDQLLKIKSIKLLYFKH